MAELHILLSCGCGFKKELRFPFHADEATRVDAEILAGKVGEGTTHSDTTGHNMTAMGTIIPDVK